MTFTVSTHAFDSSENGSVNRHNSASLTSFSTFELQRTKRLSPGSSVACYLHCWIICLDHISHLVHCLRALAATIGLMAPPDMIFWIIFLSCIAVNFLVTPVLPVMNVSVQASFDSTFRTICFRTWSTFKLLNILPRSRNR